MNIKILVCQIIGPAAAGSAEYAYANAKLIIASQRKLVTCMYTVSQKRDIILLSVYLC